MKTIITSSKKIFNQQHADNLYLILDNEDMVIDCNEMTSHYFGIPANKIKGALVWSLFDRFDHPLNYSGELTSLAYNYPIIARHHLLNGQQGIIWNLVANPNKKNQKIFIAQVFENDKNDLTLQAIIEAKELAEKGNTAKLNFLANMSHELRNSLNGLLGMAQMLSMRNLPADTQDYVKDIFQSGNHLLSLVNDMLDFAKLEAGQLTFRSEPFNLRKLIADVVEGLAKQCEQRDLDLILDYCDNVPRFVIGDANRLRQIIINLVNNAIKFTPSGHVLVAVDVVNKEKERATLQIIIEDTGIGIPESRLESVFNRFTQVSNDSYSTQNKGTGLGLAIVKQLAEKSGGEISVRSGKGKGATFIYTVPFKLQPGAFLNTTWQQNYKDLRILVIDDNIRRGSVVARQAIGNDNISCLSHDALNILNEAKLQARNFRIILIDDKVESITKICKNIKADPELAGCMLCVLSQLKKSGSYPEQFFHEVVKPIDPTLFNKDLCHAWERWQEERKVKLNYHIIKLKKPSILLVEDNPMNQKVATLMFKELGCEVTLAEDATQAMEKINRKYDIIFLDIGLPDLDGCELAKKIVKELNCNQETPIIALTAHALDHDRERFIAAGMKDVLTKPINFKSAQETVTQWTN